MELIYFLNSESLEALSETCLQRIPAVESEQEKSKLLRTAFALSKLSQKVVKAT